MCIRDRPPLFAIVLMHEFGHQLACRSVGGQTHDIVLWLSLIHIFLRAAPGHPETGHDFIKNEQSAVRQGDFAEKFQVARTRQIQAGVARDRFDDDAGDLVRVCLLYTSDKSTRLIR